jgi:hypothetical protein
MHYQDYQIKENKIGGTRDRHVGEECIRSSGMNT